MFHIACGTLHVVPVLFQDETVGAEAKKTFDDAMEMLDEIVKNKSLQARRCPTSGPGLGSPLPHLHRD